MLCRVSIFPAVADAALNALYEATTASYDGRVNGTYNGSAVLVQAQGGQEPTLVLDMGGAGATVAGARRCWHCCLPTQLFVSSCVNQALA